MNCKKLVSLFVLIAFAAQIAAATINLVPDWAQDRSDGSNHQLTPSERAALANSDDSRYQTGNWPNGYNDNNYIEFRFPNSVPAGTTINSVTLTVEHSRGFSVNAMRVRIRQTPGNN